jgi:hypothetical protein
MDDWRELLLEPRLGHEDLASAFCRSMEESPEVESVSSRTEVLVTCEVHLRSGRTVPISLNGLLDQLCAEPVEAREALLARRVAVALDEARRIDAPARADVVPVVRDNAWVTAALARTPALAWEPLVADLCVVYAWDRPAALTALDWSTLEALGLSRAQARGLALDNLRARLGGGINARGDGKASMLLSGGSFESSLILLDDLWAQIRERSPGELVACVVAQNQCLITSTAVHGGLDSLIAARERARASSPPELLLSGVLLLRTSGGWIPMPEPTAVAGNGVRRPSAPPAE